MSSEKLPGLPDVASAICDRMALARIAVERATTQAAMTSAAHSLGYGVCPGARSPVGLARRATELVEIIEVKGDNRKERLTPLGYRTARERLPRALSVLDASDARLEVAMRYRDLVERVGSVGGRGGLLDGGPTGRISDGGAVHRTDIAAELRKMRARLVGIALARGNARGVRRDVTVLALVDGVVLGGLEIKAVLRAHGWSGKGLYVKQLTEALHDALSGMGGGKRAPLTEGHAS